MKNVCAGWILATTLSLTACAAAQPVLSVSTSLPIRPQREPARAFDGQLDTYFSSARPPRDGDDFTVTFPARTSLTRVEVLTGKPNGENRLAYGTLEVSADGTNFIHGTGFTNGVAQLDLVPSPLMALRVRVTGGSDAVLSIREFRIEGPQPRPAIQFVTRVEADWSAAPECAAFGQRSAEFVREWYPRLRELLASAQQPPPASVVRLTFLPMEGVAFTLGSNISIAAEWVTQKAPQDYGMVIHELVHVVQDYGGGGEGWLTEGLADYIRDFVFEPGARTIELDPDKASYRDGYTTSALFLDWMTQQKHPDLIIRLNAASREHRSVPDVFQQETGQSVDDAWALFVASRRASKT